jgi:galactokinase
MTLNRVTDCKYELEDLVEFERALADARDSKHGPFGIYFKTKAPIFVVRAPARLDCMGGIADYSGAMVCEMPLDRAVVLGIQARDDRKMVIHSEGVDVDGLITDVELPLSEIASGRGVNYDTLRARFAETPATAWAGYVAGAFSILRGEGYIKRFPHGATIVLVSNIPLGAGISSSAALEVAALRGLCLLYEIQLEDMVLASLAQKVENRIVGAPCGIMDQVTSALGLEGRLLCLHCQPHTIQMQLELPEQLHLIGINSNVRHHVGGVQYTSTRVGAFMGLAMIQAHIRRTTGRSQHPVPDYLCNIPSFEFETAYRSFIPKKIRGRTYIKTFTDTPDPVTSVDPNFTYKVRSRVEHPVYEHERVESFIAHLKAASRTGQKAFLESAGRFMFASDWSYIHRCGLGSPETSWLVREIKNMGPKAGFYGAKITGGGSGGTVAVAGDERMFDHLEHLLVRYVNKTGIKGELFTGTSPGAVEFGHVVYRRG